MKRLLAYLFVILGLGLTFNISDSNALTKKEIQKKYGYNDDYICISKISDKYIIGNNDYVCKNDIKIIIYKKQTSLFNSVTHYFLRYAKNNPDFPNDSKKCLSLGNTCKDTSWKPLTDSILTAMIGKKIAKPLLKYKSNIKIAKAEPSQTQKVAKKGIKIDLVFCSDAGYKGVYLGTKCPSSRKYKISYNNYLKPNLNLCYLKNNPQELKIIQTEAPCNSIYDKSGIPITHQGNGNFYVYGVDILDTQIAKAEPSQTQNVAKKIISCPKRPKEIQKQGMSSIYNSCHIMKDLYSKNDTIKIFGTSKNKSEYFWGHINKNSNPSGYVFYGDAKQRTGNSCIIRIFTNSSETPLELKKINYKFETSCSGLSKEPLLKFSYDKSKNIYKVSNQNIFISDNANKLREYVEGNLGNVLDTREKLFAAELEYYIDGIKKRGEKPNYDKVKSAEENWRALSSQLDEILKTQTKKKVKVAKAEEPKQEEFKPENKDIDNDAPVIEIAQNITVNDSTYEIEGKVIDKSKKLFVQIDGETIPVKKGKFKIKRFSPVDEQLKIVALDQWGNKSKPKLVNITIDLKETELAEKLEQLNPSLIKSTSNKNRVALIIGIEKYEQTPAANFANLDAQYFYEYARKGFGIQKSNIKLLVDEDADLVKSISSINKWLPSKIKKNKTELIIFFAGHGLASNNGQELYILPQDSDPDLLSRTALSRTELFEQIISLSPKSVTMFMDTCYSGISRDEKMLLASARPIRIVADDQEDIPDNFTIFTASKLDQISSGLEEAKHGIFSYYLMKGLEGKADINQDKKITNGELLAYMDENVSQKASELGRQQNPSLAGDPNKILMSYR